MTDPELIADYECHTGENPIWHPDEQRLFWVDIPTGRLFAYDPIRDEHSVVYERNGAIGGITIQRDGALLLFEEEGRIETWHPTLETTTVLYESIKGEEGSRFNDVIADPIGGVFCGTMPQGSSPGRLYRLSTDGTITPIETGVKIPNGLGFAPDHSELYFTETEADTIYKYSFDSDTGNITDRHSFIDTSDEPGKPDGLTIDSAGYLWSASWGGSCIIRYDTQGRVVRRFEFPATKVSSITFGGPTREDCYVTTALTNGTRTDEDKYAGGLFRFSPDVTGVPEFRSALDVHTR